MELPSRSQGDELLKPGEMTRLRERLRRLAPANDLTPVIAYAFDRRSRMLPFLFADTKMAPAGVRSVGAALLDSGFSRTRIVLQQWNPNFTPSKMQLDGQVPDLFLVSSMLLHSSSLVRGAAPRRRPHRPRPAAAGRG